MEVSAVEYKSRFERLVPACPGKHVIYLCGLE